MSKSTVTCIFTIPLQYMQVPSYHHSQYIYIYMNIDHIFKNAAHHLHNRFLLCLLVNVRIKAMVELKIKIGNLGCINASLLCPKLYSRTLISWWGYIESIGGPPQYKNAILAIRNFYYIDKRPSYLYNGNPYTRKDGISIKTGSRKPDAP